MTALERLDMEIARVLARLKDADDEEWCLLIQKLDKLRTRRYRARMKAGKG